MSRSLEQYSKVIIGNLQKKFSYKNPMQVPKIEKIVINMGLSDAVSDNKVIKSATNELGLISGQKPLVTRAKTSIATFKLREGMPIGCKVTLRKKKMYEFLDRLVYIALPRVRDFRGLSTKSFDGRGNFSFGIKEQIVFPEISYDKIDKVRGMDIIIVTSANTNEQALELLKEFNVPFKK
jgi:large subunit ribosomal protein L5